MSAENRRRLLILAPHFPPENTSGAARPARFARYLRAAGWDVAVIARAIEGLPATPGVDRVSERGAASRALALAQRWLLPLDDRLPWAPAAAAAVAARWRTAPPEPILSTQPPASAHLAGLLVKLRWGVPWVADFRDPLWGNPFRGRRRARALDPPFERLIMRHADAVLANTDAMFDLFRARHPRHAAKMHLIWNGYDPADGLRARPPARRAQPRICHVGTLYGGRTPLVVAESLARLVRTGRLGPGGAQLRLIGPAEPGLIDPAREPYRTLQAAGCLWFDGVQVGAVQAQDEMLDADILLLLDNNATNAGLQAPAKLFDYARAERPILAITAPGSPTTRVLAMSGVPHAALAPDAAPDRLDDLLAAWVAAPPPSTPPSEAFRQAFDGAAQAAAVGAILDALQPP